MGNEMLKGKKEKEQTLEGIVFSRLSYYVEDKALELWITVASKFKKSKTDNKGGVVEGGMLDPSVSST